MKAFTCHSAIIFLVMCFPGDVCSGSVASTPHATTARLAPSSFGVLENNFLMRTLRGGDETGSPSLSLDNEPQQVRDLLTRIRNLLNGGSDSGTQKRENSGSGQNQQLDGKQQRHEEALLWRQLGKLRLDKGEYAEASRIFRFGSSRCPQDKALHHHVLVHQAFHEGENQELSANSADKAQPAPLELPENFNQKDIFLSLEVPDSAVPESILNFCKRADSATTTKKPPPTRLLHASTKPILPPSACRYLIQAAIEAAQRRGGWTTDRHVDAPTCDIPVFDLSAPTVGWVRTALVKTLFPLIASAFEPELRVQPDMLRIQDCFIVRYDGSEGGGSDVAASPGFASLRPHEDESLISLTIALNDMSEYEGGGLFVSATGDLLNGDAGTVLCFAGGVVHGGYPVTRGTRWIMTVFINVDGNVGSGRDPGYTLRQVQDGIVVESK